MKSDEARQVPNSAEVVLNPDEVTLPQELEKIPRDQLADSYRRLQLLYELSRRICAETSVDNVFAEVLSALQQLFVAERCFVATMDSKSRLQLRSSGGVVLADETGEWPVSKTIVKRVYQQGVAVWSPNALMDFPGAPSVGRHSIRSVICAPLGPQPARIGVLYADSTAESNKFSELDLSFLSLLAHFSYLAASNASRLCEVEDQRRLSVQRCTALQSELLREHHIIGDSDEIREAFELLKRAARSDLPILLLGESGTGKELFARAAHRLSARRNECFMPVHIAAEPEELLESSLFGHEPEAFTGATRRKIGKFEMANKGTLFLDELAEMPLSAQAKLLRVIEERCFERVGGTQTIHVDFRLVCATNRDLESEVAAGRFREDLYFRVNGVSITLPPLRRRREDIARLAVHFLSRLGVKRTFDSAAFRLMQEHAWPGNVRELAHVVERVVVMCEDASITAAQLQKWLGSTTAVGATTLFPRFSEVVSQAEREHIRRALIVSQGHRERAAKILGIAKGTLYSKMEKHGIGGAAEPS